METFLQPNNREYSTVKRNKRLEVEEVLWVMFPEVLVLLLSELNLWQLPEHNASGTCLENQCL